jgi:ParB family chromosome partitioning protein
VIEEKIAVRKLEKLVHEELAGGKKEGKEEKNFDQNVTQRLIAGLSDELQKMLSTKVTIDYSQSKGKISIHFYSDDELTHIVDRLKEGCQK